MCINCFSPVGLTIIPVLVMIFTQHGTCPPVHKIQNVIQTEVKDYDTSNLNKYYIGKSAEEQSSKKTRYGPIAGLHVLTGKSKEWSNFQHSRPIKRSEDSLNKTLCASIPDGLGGLNTSNPLSKYHCPINLLYGNNLTVKNFFLMVPKTNDSSDDSLYRLESMDQRGAELKPIQQSKLENNNSVNEVGSLLPNSPLDNNYSTQPPPSIDINLTQDNELTISLCTVAPGVGTESLEKPTITTLPSQTLTSENSFNSSVTSSSEELTTSLSSDGLTLETTINAASETPTTPSIDNSVSSTIASIEATGTGSSCPGPENSTTLDMSNEILRTLDKYCETYVATATTSTLLPSAQIERQAHFYPVLGDNNKVVKVVAHVDQPKKQVNIMQQGNGNKL